MSSGWLLFPQLRLLSECRSDRAFEMILDEFFVFSRGIDFFQLLDARILSVGLGGYEDVNKRVVSTFNQQGILGGIQLSNEGIGYLLHQI